MLSSLVVFKNCQDFPILSHTVSIVEELKLNTSLLLFLLIDLKKWMDAKIGICLQIVHIEKLVLKIKKSVVLTLFFSRPPCRTIDLFILFSYTILDKEMLFIY